MKNFNKIFLVGLALVLAWGCKKIEDIVVLNPNAKLVATVSASNVVLLKESANLDAITVSWTTPDFGFQAAPSYSVLVDKKGGDFSKAAVISVGSELKKVFKVSELNGILISMRMVTELCGMREVFSLPKIRESNCACGYFSQALVVFTQYTPRGILKSYEP